jgi:hypothetical protein
MQQLHSDLWVAGSPLRFLGLEMGARMTVMRLPNGKLMLHSPIAADPALVREVQALGPVAYLIAPNKLHHLFVAQWQDTCPDALLYVAPGLDTKRSDLAIDGVLGDSPHASWKDVIDQVFLGGFSFVNEVAFFHAPSATLILTDLAFNVGPESPPLTRAFFRLGGTYGRLSPTLLERILVRDRAMFRAALERILEWPFERIVVAHGGVKETGGREELMQGYAWVLDRGTA